MNLETGLPQTELLQTLLLKIVASWAEPGHLATIFVNSKFALDVACTFIEKNYFLFLYISGSSPPEK